jgi:hypothetical protein
MKGMIAGLLAATWTASVLAPAGAQPAEPAKKVEADAPPKVTLLLLDREGRVVPHRQCCNHTGAGNIDVAQPTPDTLVITMAGAAVAGAHPCKPSHASQDFDLKQCFEVVFDKPGTKPARLTLEARVIGVLRTHCCGGGYAEETGGCATVTSGPAPLANLCVPAHSVAAGENLSVNDHTGPVSAPVTPGKYTLHQVFRVAASHPRSLLPCKAASAEFAPDPALDPLWISYWEPFHGVAKKDFGFQVVLKVYPE